jgi:hypothetical protein
MRKFVQQFPGFIFGILLLVAALIPVFSLPFLQNQQAASAMPGIPRMLVASTPSNYLPVISTINKPSISGCSIFPYDNVWNTPVDTLPAITQPDNVGSIGKKKTFHADFGSGIWNGAPIGIPFVVVTASQPKVNIKYVEYGDESDPGPFPIPRNAPVEGGAGSSGDRHVLVLDSSTCTLYELYHAYPQSNGSWNADSGAKYNLIANGPLRTAGWTSADAAGLPILPGLARYDEVAEGEIRHALRFTAPCTQDNYIWPARHKAGSCGSNYPPMGQRFRLKASFDISGAPAQTQVILRAMKKYGIILADNGSSWYITGAPDERWNEDHLHWLDSNLHGSDMEAVDTSSMMIDPDSGQARLP